METENKTTEAKTAEKTKKYRCHTKCYFLNILWYEGDTVDFPPSVKVPEHFTEIKQLTGGPSSHPLSLPS